MGMLYVRTLAQAPCVHLTPAARASARHFHVLHLLRPPLWQTGTHAVQICCDFASSAMPLAQVARNLFRLHTAILGLRPAGSFEEGERTSRLLVRRLAHPVRKLVQLGPQLAHDVWMFLCTTFNKPCSSVPPFFAEKPCADDELFVVRPECSDDG